MGVTIITTSPSEIRSLTIGLGADVAFDRLPNKFFNSSMPVPFKALTFTEALEKGSETVACAYSIVSILLITIMYGMFLLLIKFN